MSEGEYCSHCGAHGREELHADDCQNRAPSEHPNIRRGRMMELWVEATGLQDTDSPLTNAVITEGLEAAGAMDGSDPTAEADAAEVVAGLERLRNDIDGLIRAIEKEVN